MIDEGLLDGVQRILLAHAHPDDESISTGALVAHLVRRGIAVDLVTATRGELGEVVPGPLSPLAGTEALEEHRAGELRAAVEALGIDRHAYLGTPPARATGREPRRYRDSGMVWIREGLAGPANVDDERSFTAAPLAEATDDLVALVEAWQPDLLVSYDAGGGYGHPDHVRMHQLAALAAGRTHVALAEVRHERPGAQGTDEQGRPVEWFELDEELDTVVAALRCHATQLTVQDNGTEIVHSGGQREAITLEVGLAPGIPA